MEYLFFVDFDGLVVMAVMAVMAVMVVMVVVAVVIGTYLKT
jgi:hypothetical protein